jgi:hypothetical protein
MYTGVFAVMLYDYQFSTSRFSDNYYFALVCVFFMFVGSFFQYQKSDKLWRLLLNLFLSPIVLAALFLISAIELETVIIDLAVVDISIFYLAGFAWLIVTLTKDQLKDYKKNGCGYLVIIGMILFGGYALVLLLLEAFEVISGGSNYMVWVLVVLGIIGVVDRYQAMVWAKRDKKTLKEWKEFGLHLLGFIGIVIIYNYLP